MSQNADTLNIRLNQIKEKGEIELSESLNSLQSQLRAHSYNIKDDFWEFDANLITLEAQLDSDPIQAIFRFSFSRALNISLTEYDALKKTSIEYFLPDSIQRIRFVKEFSLALLSHIKECLDKFNIGWDKNAAEILGKKLAQLTEKILLDLNFNKKNNVKQEIFNEILSKKIIEDHLKAYSKSTIVSEKAYRVGHVATASFSTDQVTPPSPTLRTPELSPSAALVNPPSFELEQQKVKLKQTEKCVTCCG